MPPVSALTPAQITDLRASIRYRGATVGKDAESVYVIYYPADAAFGLVVGSRLMAISADLEALASCLVAERAERGFIARVLDSAEPPDGASLDPAGRARANASRAADAARLRLQEDADADYARRRASHIDVAKLDLEDLL